MSNQLKSKEYLKYINLESKKEQLDILATKLYSIAKEKQNQYEKAEVSNPITGDINRYYIENSFLLDEIKLAQKQVKQLEGVISELKQRMGE